MNSRLVDAQAASKADNPKFQSDGDCWGAAGVLLGCRWGAAGVLLVWGCGAVGLWGCGVVGHMTPHDPT